MNRARPSLLTVLAALIVAMSAIGSYLYATNVEEARERLLTEVRSRNDLRAVQLAGTVAKQAEALIRLFDIASVQLAKAYADGDSQFKTVVRSVLEGVPENAVHLVVVIDATGHVSYSSDGAVTGANLGDRQHFRFHADGGKDRLFIGSPFIGRLTEKTWLIPISRAIRQNGRFAGVVSITIHPKYLGDALAALSLNTGDVVALVKNDGTFLARNHHLEEAMGRKAPADRPFLDPSQDGRTTFRATSSVDGVPLDFAWKRLEPWPLISVVALDEGAELAPIHAAITLSKQRSTLTVAGIMTFSIMIAGLLLLAENQKRVHLADEDLLRSVMDSLRNAIVVIDHQGCIIKVNEAWQTFGRCNGAGMDVVDGIGVNYFDECQRAGQCDPLAAEAYQGMRDVLDGRRNSFFQEYPCDSLSETRWFEFRVTPLSGRRHGLVASHLDISDRKAMELTLKRVNSELEQFAYVASHDLRQPLRMVSSYLGLIERRLNIDADEDLKTFFGFAVDGAKRMDRMILDLLEYSRTGRHEASFQPTRLSDVIAIALTNLEVAVTEAEAAIEVMDNLPTILGSQTELERLFQNLIGNAIKYRTPDRPIRVLVECRPSGSEWIVSVRDNGIGIAPNDRERAFMIFQRLVSHDAYEGTGIGLAVCKKIVESHGGEIWIEDGLEGGASVCFSLPKG